MNEPQSAPRPSYVHPGRASTPPPAPVHPPAPPAAGPAAPDTPPREESTTRKVLAFAGEGILFVIGGIFGAIMDFLGFWFMIALYIALIIGASLIHPTLGAVVLGLIILGHLLPVLIALGAAGKGAVDSVRRRER
ncbi:hypothetical protein ACFQ0K_12180 [Nocardioides caeni]|uniref:Uncharacterized protein n=1 Tax=Nocardioides caeni TaxID=574700 RepID=A0A4S8NQN9_9ACTN|nr:hypothetical protein [Nocardioides caeni]THV17804.1 hypothetical protein E9934_04890 [Nocardioides caeni]